MAYNFVTLPKVEQALEYIAQAAHAAAIQELAGRDKRLARAVRDAFRVAVVCDSNDLSRMGKYLEEFGED